MATGPIDTRHIGTRRGRFGCLGCLGKLLVYLVLGMLTLGAIDAVFAPWSFFMGGRFHPIPLRRGWGKPHSASGRDYILFVWVQASPSRS